MSEIKVKEGEKVYGIAKACHQANKAWCEANGDDSQKDWNFSEEWQRISAINGVKFRLENPEAKDDAMHNAWMKEKLDDGWVYGDTKDPEKKTHPCLVPFDQLPEFQQKKDALFVAIVDSLTVNKEAEQLKIKADKWDELSSKIAKCYDQEGDESGEADLLTIGEIAATACGWL